MAGLNAGDIVAVTMIGTCAGQRVQQQMIYEVQVGSISTSTLTAQLNLANDIAAAPAYWPRTMWNNAVQNYTWDFLRVQKVYNGRAAFSQTAGLGAGQLAQDAPSVNVNASVEKRTDVGKRYGVGRMTTTPLPASQMQNGLLTAAALTAWGLLATAMMQNISATTDGTVMYPVLWSIKVPTRPLPLESCNVQGTVRVQRRRTVGVGK